MVILSPGNPPRVEGKTPMSRPKQIVRILQEFSLPLLIGVIGGLLAANMAPEWYAHYFGDHHGTLPFIINNIFMAFFFGIAAKEITEAALPMPQSIFKL